MVSGASNTLIRGLGRGFAVAPFLDPANGLMTIPFEFVPEEKDIVPNHSELPSSTTQRDYFHELDAIISGLNGTRGKTVAARVINIEMNFDLNATFESLCDNHPDAFVFAFSTSETGTWIGASPELLLRVDDNTVYTMALAGTRPSSPAGSDPEWDSKNIDEQKMVEEFIRECLKGHCSEVASEMTFTKKAGAVEHICTSISAKFPESKSSHLSDLLTSLSPTPAVCGNDRRRSLDIIRRYEHFERELYGGFCGPCGLDDATTFFVILRAAKCNPTGVCVFAGGGITALSIPEEEWNETEMKSKTIINQLKTSEE